MVRHASLFSQLVALFKRERFQELVFRHGSERYAKGFSSWDQFVARRVLGTFLGYSVLASLFKNKVTTVE